MNQDIKQSLITLTERWQKKLPGTIDEAYQGIADIINPTDKAVHQKVAKPDHVAPTGEMKKYSRAIDDAIQAVCERTRREAERCARHEIIRVMGILTERVGASSSWLFLKKLKKNSTETLVIEPVPKTGLTMTFCLNTGKKTLILFPWDTDRPLNERGIVGHVARTRRPYLSNDVKNDRFYQNTNPPTESEIAVPILLEDSSGQQQLLGILNFESIKPDTFISPQMGELVAAATELVPHILVLHSLKSNPDNFGWHYNAHGWTPEQLLADFCTAVSFTDDPNKIGDPSVILDTNPLPRPSCTIWYFDPDAADEEKLFVRATSRFDHEYITDRRLPFSEDPQENSFTGKVVHMPREHVAYGTPKELEPNFKRGIKAGTMDLVYTFASPIYRPPNSPDDKNAIGSVNVYFFGQELKNKSQELKNKGINLDANTNLDAEFPGIFNIVATLAERVGELVTSCQELRIEVAAAYLHFRLQQHSLPCLTDFDTAKDVILECLDADRCSIFIREARKLTCVATTGLTTRDGTPVAADTAVYDLDDPNDRGLTTFLGKGLGQKVRCFSVDVLDSTKSASNVPPPVNKFREMFSLTETLNGPFLGISVDNPAEKGAESLPLGVMRVIRRYSSKPFVKTDETVLCRLARVCLSAFVRRQQMRDEVILRSLWRGKRYPFLISALGDSAQPHQMDAIDRLASAFPAAAIWNRQQVDAVLLDLVNVFREPKAVLGSQGAFMASLRVLQPSNEDKPQGLKIYAIRSFLSTDLPEEKYIEKHFLADEKNPSVGLHAIWHHQPVTFARKQCLIYQPILPESMHVKSGICMPVRTVSNNGVFWSVLSLDFDNLDLESWKQDYIKVVALAAKQLNFIGRDNRLRDDREYSCETWLEACDCFLKKTLAEDDKEEEKEVGVKCAGFFRKEGPKWKSLISCDVEQEKSIDDATKDLPETPITGDSDIKWNCETGGFEIPLWYGPFPSDLTLRGFLTPAVRQACQNDKETETLRRKLCDIDHLWNRFVSSSVGTGVQPFFNLSFEPGQEQEGMMFWKPNLSLSFNSSDR